MTQPVQHGPHLPTIFEAWRGATIPRISPWFAVAFAGASYLAVDRIATALYGANVVDLDLNPIDIAERYTLRMIKLLIFVCCCDIAQRSYYRFSNVVKTRFPERSWEAFSAPTIIPRAVSYAVAACFLSFFLAAPDDKGLVYLCGLIKSPITETSVFDHKHCRVAALANVPLWAGCIAFVGIDLAYRVGRAAFSELKFRRFQN